MMLNFILHVMVVVDPNLVNALQGEIGSPQMVCVDKLLIIKL